MKNALLQIAAVGYEVKSIDLEALDALRDMVGKDTATVMVEVIDSDLEDASQLEETICTTVNPDDSLWLSYKAL